MRVARLVRLLLALGLLAGLPALVASSASAVPASAFLGSVYSCDAAGGSTTATADSRVNSTQRSSAGVPWSSTSSLPRGRAAKGGSTALQETRTGLGFTGHGADRFAERGVRTPDALDAWRNPLKRGPVVVDELGRPGQKLIGRDATIVINPETNKIVTGNPTSRRVRERLLRQMGGG